MMHTEYTRTPDDHTVLASHRKWRRRAELFWVPGDQDEPSLYVEYTVRRDGPMRVECMVLDAVELVVFPSEVLGVLEQVQKEYQSG